MAWFRKPKRPKPVVESRPRSTVPEGLWVKCEGCREVVYSKELERNLRICPKCDYHFRIDSSERIALLIDDPGAARFHPSVSPGDPLGFKDTKPYSDRLRAYQKGVGSRDAIVSLEGTLEGIPVVLAVMEYRFMGGSMGSVVGEMITRAVETCLEKRRPLIVVSASGGARMQEGILSLMQMAKISAALALLDKARLPFISVLTDPTTGGVTASFAMLGDLNIAEPGALIGFAGPRVIEQTIRQSLPEGFQTSEFLLDHGFLDLVVSRKDLKTTVAKALRHLL
ncbi:MAG TPA: acetyl-CoA carboxylase, carboxyltransferase subunit beta [Thermoanaerobaculia bacterium]|nr:acetyl-CoA carboxylase, carboxyltransferase subunit beta [Thermoanaerobaculia bacterium]